MINRIGAGLKSTIHRSGSFIPRERQLTSGVEIHKIEGVDVRMTNPSKTVADCFKYRNHVGLDVAIECAAQLPASKKGDAESRARDG